MYTRQAVRDLDPDLVIQIAPLGYPPPRTTIISQITEMLEKTFPALLVDVSHNIILINTRKIIKP